MVKTSGERMLLPSGVLVAFTVVLASLFSISNLCFENNLVMRSEGPPLAQPGAE